VDTTQLVKGVLACPCSPCSRRDGYGYGYVRRLGPTGLSSVSRTEPVPAPVVSGGG
jgi:hypothetical protein